MKYENEVRCEYLLVKTRSGISWALHKPSQRVCCGNWNLSPPSPNTVLINRTTGVGFATLHSCSTPAPLLYLECTRADYRRCLPAVGSAVCLVCVVCRFAMCLSMRVLAPHMSCLDAAGNPTLCVCSDRLLTHVLYSSCGVHCQEGADLTATAGMDTDAAARLSSEEVNILGG